MLCLENSKGISSPEHKQSKEVTSGTGWQLENGNNPSDGFIEHLTEVDAIRFGYLNPYLFRYQDHDA